VVHSEKYCMFQWFYGLDDWGSIKKNYKIQNTNYKQITNYKSQITNNMAHELHELPRFGATSNKKLLRRVQGAVFSKRAPWPPEAIKNGTYQTNLRGKEKTL